MHSGRSCVAFRDFVCRQPSGARQFVAHHHEVNAMNPNTLAEDLTNTLLSVDASPIPLRLPIGSAIFAYSGEVWITQERMHDDVILGPGERFDVHSRELILASATKSPASVYVACPAELTERVDMDVYALLRQRARRLRAEELNEMGRAIGDRLSHRLAAVFAQLGAMLAPSKRVPVTNAPR
jgi:Protein of unknown function (DUF2917)